MVWATLGSGQRMRLPGPGRRLAARIIDLFLMAALFIIIFGIGATLGLSIEVSSSDMALSTRSLPIVVLMFLVVGSLYEVLPTATRGRTIGKMFAKTRVVTEDIGDVPGLAVSYRRWVVPALPLVAYMVLAGAFASAGRLATLVGVLTPVVYMSLIWDKRLRGWHDRAAGSIVVQG